MASADTILSAKKYICECIAHNLKSKDDAKFLADLEKVPLPTEVERKTLIEQAYRDHLKDLIDGSSSTDECIAIISMAIETARHEKCSLANPFVLLSDLFDCITLDKCDNVFRFIEENVSVWMSWDSFYNSGKNYLLRMCNDLLRRLSKSHNTVFCGRIQLFLARLFPLTEKSGLNLMSQFNVENVTLYTTKSEDYDKARKMDAEVEKEEDMDIEEGETDDTNNSIPIDYNLYRKFWALQDYFSKPTQCYEKMAWKTFSNYSEEVLSCFENFKLDDVKCKSNSMFMDAETFFAKYLTSEKLLDLQLSDCNFRRYVLVQFIILFQYLNAEVKFKTSSQILGEEQATWVKQCNERVMQILRDTPPDGAQFAEGIEHIMNREENWNSWKNDSCRSYVKVASAQESKPQFTRGPRKRALGDDIKANEGKLKKMGNPELTRLWNLNPDNLAACKNEKRNFLPTLDTFFEDAMDQLDPANEVEEQYFYIKNSQYAWKSLRLMARRSPHFFAQQPAGPANNAQASKTQQKYLETMLNKLAKEKNQASQNEAENKTPVENPQDDNDAENEEEEDTAEEELNNDKDDTPPAPAPELASEAQLEQLAESLKDDWSKLATELSFAEDDITFLVNESDNLKEQALSMLRLWKDNERERATVSALRTALMEIGQVAAAETLGVEKDS